MANILFDRLSALEAEKSTYTSVWQDINKFIFPNSEQFEKQTEGGARRRRVQFDGTAERALEIFAASISGMLANPSAKFINFESRNKDLAKDKAVQEFIEEAQDKVLGVFNDPASKFHDNFFHAVQNLGAYGTTAFLVDADEKHGAIFRAEGPKGLNFTESFQGSPDEVFLERKYTVRQLEQFAENEGWEVPHKIFKKKPEDKLEIVRHIYPNPDFNPKMLDPKTKRFKSDYWLKEEKVLVKESGFNTKPALIGRWGRLDNEKWGDSPGRVSLTDVKVLNASERHMTFAEEYSLRPALFVSSEAKFGKLNMSAGAMNVGRGDMRSNVHQLAQHGDLSFSLERNRLRREVVMQAFFVDVFQTLSDNNMTATEVQIRAQEKLRGLAPKASRIQSDILGPTAERVLAILIDQGKIVPPESLAGQELEVTYLSPLAQAQRSSDATNIQLFMQDVGMLAQGFPTVLDKIDSDELLEEMAEIRGIPTKAMLSDKQVREARQQRAQQQQLQQTMEMAQQAGDAGQSLKALGDGQATQ